MTSKDFYRNYLADDSLSDLSSRLISEIVKDDPVHALDFGCGTGKHSSLLNELGVYTICLDISFQNVLSAKIKHDLPCVVCADELFLRNIANCDVVFTCSVLDHIQDIDGIIGEFKRIANKSIYLAETNSFSSSHYYQHDYEQYGFKKVIDQIEVTSKSSKKREFLDGEEFFWQSDQSTGDGGIYHIWKWTKQ